MLGRTTVVVRSPEWETVRQSDCVCCVDVRRRAHELAARAPARGAAAVARPPLRTDAPFVPRTQHRFPYWRPGTPHTPTVVGHLPSPVSPHP